MNTEMRVISTLPRPSSRGGTAGPTAEMMPSAGLTTRRSSTGVTAEDFTGSVFEFMEPLGLLPVQAVAHVRAVYDETIGWGPRRPARPLYVCLDQVHYLADGRPVSSSQAYFVEDKVEFTLVRTR